MPREAAHLFIHPGSIGNPEICAEVHKSARAWIRSVVVDRQPGHRLAIVHDEAEADEHLLWYMADYAATTQGRFPFVFCLLQPPESFALDVDAAMLSLGFVRIA